MEASSKQEMSRTALADRRIFAGGSHTIEPGTRLERTMIGGEGRFDWLRIYVADDFSLSSA